MTPEERQRWLDAVEGKPYIPQGTSKEYKPEHTLTLVGVSLCFLFWLYKCWEFVTSAGPNDGRFGLAFVTVILVLGICYWVWEIRAALKSKEKELAKEQDSPPLIAEEEETPEEKSEEKEEEEKKETVWGEEECRQWWERKVSASPASQSRLELIEEWEVVEKEWEIAEEIRKHEEEEERERMKALERQEESGWIWSAEEVDLGDYDGDGHDSSPRNDDPNHYDYEPDMDDGEYNPYEDDID